MSSSESVSSEDEEESKHTSSVMRLTDRENLLNNLKGLDRFKFQNISSTSSYPSLERAHNIFVDKVQILPSNDSGTNEIIEVIEEDSAE